MDITDEVIAMLNQAETQLVRAEESAEDFDAGCPSGLRMAFTAARASIDSARAQIIAERMVRA